MDDNMDDIDDFLNNYCSTPQDQPQDKKLNERRNNLSNEQTRKKKTYKKPADDSRRRNNGIAVLKAYNEKRAKEIALAKQNKEQPQAPSQSQDIISRQAKEQAPTQAQTQAQDKYKKLKTRIKEIEEFVKYTDIEKKIRQEYKQKQLAQEASASQQSERRVLSSGIGIRRFRNISEISQKNEYIKNNLIK